MKTIDTAKYIMITYTFTRSFLAGVGFLSYVLYTDKKIKNLENQIRAALLEDDKKILNKDLESFEVKGNVSNFEVHEDCVIENYQNKFYRILKPDGEYLPKIFLSLDEAKKEIDIVAPALKKPVRERNRIYNIRYVR